VDGDKPAVDQVSNTSLNQKLEQMQLERQTDWQCCAMRLLAVDLDAKPHHFGDILTWETTFTYYLFSN
jgi:hypothetical protein